MERLAEDLGMKVSKRQDHKPKSQTSLQERELSNLDADTGSASLSRTGRGKRKTKSRYASRPKNEIKDYHSFDKKGLSGRFKV